jgi:hypothetical protein
MSRRMTVASCVAAMFLAAVAARSFAAEVTVTGDAACGKCVLKETKECQIVLKAKEGEKTVTYYFVDNDVSKKFHDSVSKEAKKATATGTVKEEDGKKLLTATKIEVVK